MSTNKTTPIDYTQYAAAAEIPAQTERRKFNFLSLSGKVDEDENEKRLPAKAYKIFLAEEKGADGKNKTEDIAVPFSVVPIKLRYVMEAKRGSQGEILDLKSSEFNGLQTDMVTVSKYSDPDATGNQKIVKTHGPMTVANARKMFIKPDGKQALRDKAHVYSLHNGDLVRYVVKGTGLWEDESTLGNGKGAEAQKKHKFLKTYLSEFDMATNPYFIYEMNVGAVYRNHAAVKYYRPTFEKGARISAEVEKKVLETLLDLKVYFDEQDASVKAFTPETPAPALEEGSTPKVEDLQTEPEEEVPWQ